MNLFEFLLLILTGAGIIVGTLTYSIYGKQIKQMRTDRRAWMTLSGTGDGKIQVTANEAGEKTLSAAMQISNTGQTPAKSVDIKFLLTVVPNGTDNPDSYTGAGMENTASIFYPNNSVPITLQLLRENPNTATRTSSRYLSEKEYQELIDGFSYIVVIARGRYTDIFGTEHWLRYCSAVSPPGSKATQITSRNCVDFNNVDDN